jgi:hypothetical protein
MWPVYVAENFYGHFLSCNKGSVVIFQDKAKELELLCNLKRILFDPLDHEKSVGKLM